MRPLNPDYSKEEINHFRNMRVMILIPCSYHYPKFWQCVINMVAYSWGKGLRIEESGIMERVVIDWAREDLVKQAMPLKSRIDESEITHFLWLDADHMFQPDLCLELARWNKDAVTAIYCNRDDKAPKPVVYVHKKNDESGIIHHSILSIPHGLFRCDAFGFGAVLMKKDVFERVPPPWFLDGPKGGEDLKFCLKARNHGVELWADGRYWLAHMGEPKVYTINDFEEWVKTVDMEKMGVPLKMEVQRK